MTEPAHGRGDVLADVLAAASEALVVTDATGKILCASAAAGELLGRAATKGRSLGGLVDADGRRAFRAALAAPGPAELELCLRASEDGLRVHASKRVGATGVVWSLERAARPSAEPAQGDEEILRRGRIARLVDALEEGVLTVDRQQRVELANAAAQALLAVRPDATLPARWHDFDLGSFTSALFRADALHAEALVRTTDGSSYKLIGMPTDARESAVLLLSDASGRDQREQAQREFVANAAHELRTPITGIAGAVEVLQAGAKDDPQARDRFLGHIARESSRLVRLVNSLLVLARTSSGGTGVSMSPLPVRPLLDDVAGRLRPREGVGVEVLCPVELQALADRDLVERALENVAENAVKFTHSGRILLSGHSGARGAVLEVHDSGPGIPAEVRDRVFERFYRGVGRGEDGFGLGLSIALQAVDAVGGAFELDDDPRGGTIARIVLQEPVLQEPGRAA